MVCSVLDAIPSFPSQIRSLAPLTNLDGNTLQELFCASNKVSEISTHVSHLTGLTTLELGSNRIKAIEGVSTLTNLRELWLGKNRIPAIRELGTLSLLLRISVQSNRWAASRHPGPERERGLPAILPLS